MESKNKKLRSGYTTGACAAAAAKAATAVLLNAGCTPPGPPSARGSVRGVEIPFPDGSRVRFKVQSSEFRAEGGKQAASASVIKDAGDDPDVTHGAEIVATVQSSEFKTTNPQSEIVIQGGKGVGRVTKPGLAVPVGEPAINPVPRKMIEEAVREAIRQPGAEGREQREDSMPHAPCPLQLIVTISVPAGEELAKKTLNHRLGIVGGISILGTTGIVRPISTEAYTASITAAMDVARATGSRVVVLSSGRTSEKAHMKKYNLPEESYVMMGDYLEFSLLEAKRHEFESIHLCAQWAKMIKTAMSTPQTHVRHGAIEANQAAAFLRSLGLRAPEDGQFNTVREVFDFINSAFREPQSALLAVCAAAREYAGKIASGIPVTTHLVSYEGEIIAESA